MDFRRTELENAIRGLRQIEQATATFRHAQARYTGQFEQVIVDGQKLARSAAERTGDYQKASAYIPSTTVLSGVGPGGMTSPSGTGWSLPAGAGAALVAPAGGAALTSWRDAPGVTVPQHFRAGFGLIPVTQIRTSDEVTGPENFDAGQNLADLQWAVTALLDVVLPVVGSMPDPAAFLRARDQREGLSGPRSYHATYEGFFGDRAIRLSPMSDGTFDVVNGFHRLWLLLRAHAGAVPARIVEGR